MDWWCKLCKRQIALWGCRVIWVGHFWFLAGKVEANVAVYNSLLLTPRGKALNWGKYFKGSQFLCWTLLVEEKYSWESCCQFFFLLATAGSWIPPWLVGHSVLGPLDLAPCPISNFKLSSESQLWDFQSTFWKHKTTLRGKVSCWKCFIHSFKVWYLVSTQLYMPGHILFGREEKDKWGNLFSVFHQIRLSHVTQFPHKPT